MATVPHRFSRKPFSQDLVLEVLAHRPTRLAIGGYLGHMWELYAMWDLGTGFFWPRRPPRPATARSWRPPSRSVPSPAGGLGCLWGWDGQRIDSAVKRVVNGAMAAGGVCCLSVGFLFAGPIWPLAILVWILGLFSWFADSAQFSAMVTEVCPQHAVGTALTLQTSLGFLLTTVTIHGIPHLVEAWGWPWAFPVLALGPAAGITAILRLKVRKPA